jgi:K+-sensing histidine kinase KdpD
VTRQIRSAGILCIGAIIGFSFGLSAELTGHPWWFLLMMLVCAFSPGSISFAASINSADPVINLRSRLSLAGWMKPAVVLLLVAITLGAIRIVGINPRDYGYVPLLFPVIVSSILFGFGQGLLAVIVCILMGDYLLALPVYDFRISQPEDAIGLAVFALLGGAVAWVIDEMRDIERRASD